MRLDGRIERAMMDAGKTKQAVIEMLWKRRRGRRF
jgi:hypothetical protein